MLWVGKIYNSFVFPKTYIMVAHANIVSVFDILENKWINHIVFESDIVSMLRQEGDNGMEIAALTSAGRIHMIVPKSLPDSPSTQLYEIDDTALFQLEGRLLQHTVQNDYCAWSLFLTETE